MSLDAVNKVFRSLDRELWILTADDGERRGGLVVTTVTSASIVPEAPRVMVAVAHQHATWPIVEAAGAFALHLVAPKQIERVWTFGLNSSRNTDKFAGLEPVLQKGREGAPVLGDAPAWLECRIEARMETGDRTVYLAEVTDGVRQSAEETLTVRRLIDLATPERRQQLKDGLTADGAVDAAAIRRWRTRTSSH